MRACDSTSAANCRAVSCTAEAMAAAFVLYGPRPCLGWRPRHGDGFADSYSWLSYAQTGEAAHELAALPL